MRSATEYLESLRDGRQVILDGQAVGDVTVHPAFAGVCRTMAELYERLATDPASATFPSPTSEKPVNVAHMIPRSQEALRKRRLGLSRIAEATYGLIGRGPEHVASFLAGFASNPDLFAQADACFGENVKRFHEKIREEHLYVAYTIIPPQIDRSKSSHEQEDRHLPAGVYKERDDGIIIRGAQMLGTAAPIADYLFLSCIVPLKPGDEDYALSLAVPIGAKGLRFYARRPYAVGQPGVFDYPLSTRFDESDALAVFDDVFVPWEQVFVYRNIELTRAQFFQTPAHILGNTQAQIRLAVKLKFLAGLAAKIARTNGIDKLPPVQAQLGELASLVSLIEGMVLAAESAAVTDPRGVVHPHPRFLYGAMGLQATLYPQVIHILRELAGGGYLQVPASAKDFHSAEFSDDIRRYIRSPGVAAEDRVKLFKLAWEMVGSEFAGRHQQYEMFYAGAPFVAKTYSYHNYGFDEAVRLVDQCLETYGLDGND